MGIDFDVDWYGTYNRSSAVCDYLELLAISGLAVTKPDLADIIRDSGWTILLRSRIQDSEVEDRGEEPDDDDTDLVEALGEADDHATAVVNVARERRNLLDDAYPFEVNDDGPVIRFLEVTPDESPYISLLAITVLHASRVTGLPQAAAYLFEDVLTATLNAAGLCTDNLGRHGRGQGVFAAALKHSSATVGLTADPDAAPHRVFANEEGSDTISNLWPHDLRLGGVQFIGQATCARSNDWKAKIMEPPVGHWESWLGRKLPAIAFLSVPHHVQSGTRDWLVTADRHRDVLDRIRLARVPRVLLADEKAFVSRVLEEGTVPP